MTTSRDMRLLGGSVHRFDQVAIAALEDAPLDLERRRDRSVLDGQVRREDREGADLLVVRLVDVVGVNLALEEVTDLPVRVQTVPVDLPVRGRDVLSES